MLLVADFTAIYEPHPNGVYTGYVAEIREVRTGAKTLAEARASLAERLRFYLKGEHERSLAIASEKAIIESVRVETR